MKRQRVTTFGLGLLATALALGAAPAPPSYHAVQRAIEDLRQVWAGRDTGADANITGWESFLRSLTDELARYARAGTVAERSASLDRLQQFEAALGTVPWPQAAPIRAELANWILPRRQILQAEQQIRSFLGALPPQATDASRQHSTGWLAFLDNGLLGAMREYERAGTLAARLEATRRLRSDLQRLGQANGSTPWAPSQALQQAFLSAYNFNNLEVTADAQSLAPFLARPIVQNEAIFRKGYWSYITAGAYTGFGLMDSDDGIAFFNRQFASTATPITDFQQQVASDQRGRRAAKLYQFSATSYDNPEVTAIAIIRTTGLVLIPGSSHNVAANFSSVPIAGRGLGRAVATLVGFGPRRITQQVGEGAFRQLEPSVIQGAAEEAQTRSAQQAAQLNAQARQFLVGNNTLSINPVSIVNLSLRSRSHAAYVEGTLAWNGLPDAAFGADAPQPSRLIVPNSGISADLHLGSILNSMARGFFENGPYRDVTNVLITTREAPPGTPLAQRVTVTPNASGEAFVAAARAKPANNPNVQVIRVHRPNRPPEFGVDAAGNLVALIHDVQIDIPAQGGVLYRVTSPLVEVGFNFGVENDPATGQTRFRGRLVDLNFGPRAQVLPLQADGETVGRPNFVANLVLNLISAGARNRPVDVPLPVEQLQSRGFALASVSPLDPSGWLRVVLTPTR